MAVDILLVGGEVLDPASGRAGRADVAVRDGRVAAVGPGLAREGAAAAVDCCGRVVVPGLIDLHAHVGRDLGYWGIDADAHAPGSGVTTWVDAGSTGGYAVAGLRRLVAEPARVRILAFLNVSSIGLVAPSWELSARHHLDEELCVGMARAHEGFVVGVKARIDRFTVGTLGLEPLHVALRCAQRAGLPLMVHIGHGPPPVDDVLELLRPGDVLTHCTTAASMRLVDDAGRVRPALLRAVERGVTLDIGHGSGAFAFAVAEALLSEGLRPVLSSDAHQLSVNGPMFDLPTCLTKLLALGLDLEEALGAATVRPARALHREDLGTLRVGAPADLAVLRLDPGPFRVTDVLGETRLAPRRVRVERTFVAGRELRRGPLPEPQPWVPLSEPQAQARRAAARGAPVDLPALLADPADLAPPPPLVAGEP